MRTLSKRRDFWQIVLSIPFFVQVIQYNPSKWRLRQKMTIFQGNLNFDIFLKLVDSNSCQSPALKRVKMTKRRYLCKLSWGKEKTVKQATCKKGKRALESKNSHKFQINISKRFLNFKSIFRKDFCAFWNETWPDHLHHTGLGLWKF